MSDLGVGDASKSNSVGVGGTSSVDKTGSGLSSSEADGIAADAAAAPNEAAAAVAENITASASLDTVQTAPKTEEPGLLESVGTWAGQTAKGYATGAINGVLDMANVVNMGVNAGLGVVGVDPVFRTDMKIAPTSTAEANAQNAITVATMVAGAAGAVKSAPAIARTLDGAMSWTKSALGLGAAEAPAIAKGVAPVARLGDLTPFETARIQAAADGLGQDLYVVGSAAKGTRRGVGSDLPLAEFGGPKIGTRSDIDYAVKTGFDDLASTFKLPDMDPSWGVRGVDYLNLGNSPAIRFSPGQPPAFLSGSGRILLD